MHVHNLCGDGFCRVVTVVPLLFGVCCYQVDTLVMQNLGYFQLKAAPGLWQLSIAPGRSRELYQLVSSGSGSSLDTQLWGWGNRGSSSRDGDQIKELDGEMTDYSTQALLHSFTGGTTKHGSSAVGNSSRGSYNGSGSGGSIGSPLNRLTFTMTWGSQKAADYISSTQSTRGACKQSAHRCSSAIALMIQ